MRINTNISFNIQIDKYGFSTLKKKKHNSTFHSFWLCNCKIPTYSIWHVKLNKLVFYFCVKFYNFNIILYKITFNIGKHSCLTSKHNMFLFYCSSNFQQIDIKQPK